MRLFLVRHGETVDNVAGLYAGSTDSALTNHGILQANRLGADLAAKGVKVSHIFSSDLSRAFKTAEAIRLAQPKFGNADPQTVLAKETVRLKHLREQDFGSLERKSWSDRSSLSHSARVKSEMATAFHGYKDVESKDSMGERVDTFIDQYLLQLLKNVDENHSVVVVAHGIILGHLWQSTLKCFSKANVMIEPRARAADRGFSLENLGSWSNTGYLELEIRPENKSVGSAPASPPRVEAEATPAIQVSLGLATSSKPTSTKNSAAAVMAMPAKAKLHDMRLLVKVINSVQHLGNLKKTRGGIGSSAHDESQRTLESFFKKRKLG